MKVFVMPLGSKILYGIALVVPPLFIFCVGIDTLVERPREFIAGALMVVAGGAATLWWTRLMSERIEIDQMVVRRKTLFGTKEIPLSDILSARCGMVGRGTALVITLRTGDIRIGMSLPKKMIEELAGLINGITEPHAY